MDRYRLAVLAVLLCCLTTLCYAGKIAPEVFLSFLGGLAVPAYDTLRQRGTAGPALPAAAAAPPQPPLPLQPLIPLPVPPAELPLSAAARLDVGWVLPEPSEPTQVGPPPLVAIPGRPGAELGAVVAATAQGSPESRALNKQRLVAEVQALKGVGPLLALLLLPGCANAAQCPPALAVAVGWAGAWSGTSAGRRSTAAPFAQLRSGAGKVALVGGLALGALSALMGCTPAQRAAGDRYGAALLACGVREAPMGLQQGVSAALHAAAGADWRSDLIGLGARFSSCLVDAEVLRYALGDPGPQVRSQALALRQPGELGAAPQPAADLGQLATQLATQRATEWITTQRAYGEVPGDPPGAVNHIPDAPRPPGEGPGAAAGER